jgi:hypothetical protein
MSTVRLRWSIPDRISSLSALKDQEGAVTYKDQNRDKAAWWPWSVTATVSHQMACQAHDDGDDNNLG